MPYFHYYGLRTQPFQVQVQNNYKWLILLHNLPIFLFTSIINWFIVS